MGEGSARIYNLISIVFLVLTVLVVVFGLLRLLGPAAPDPSAALVVPTQAVLPTATDTPTPRPTIPPTWTLTPTLTVTPSPTTTPSPTITNTPPIVPSATITASATITNTPPVTPTDPPPPTQEAALPTAAPALPTVDPSLPTVAPPSPFPFALRGNSISFTTNFANSAGCSWQGIGGSVIDLTGQAFPNLRIHVYDGQGFDQIVATGTNSLYGQGSGWEVPVANAPNTNTYFVELMSPEMTPISLPVQITFTGTCETNLALVNFEQVRPF